MHMLAYMHTCVVFTRVGTLQLHIAANTFYHTLLMPEYRMEWANYVVFSQGCNNDFGLVQCDAVSLDK
jgi:hypothetical protein